MRSCVSGGLIPGGWVVPGRFDGPEGNLTVAQGGAMNFDFGVYANRRESLGQGGAEHGVQGQLIARW